MSSIRRRWKWWLGGAVVVVVLVAVVAPFVYIHFIEGSPKPKFGLTHDTSSSHETVTAASVDGTWQVSSGSQAGYRVDEILFGQNSTAVGRTSQVTGQIAIAGTTVERGTFTVEMASVTSDRSQRDGQFRGRIMEVSKYPTSTFELSGPIDFGSIPSEGKQITTTATGRLTMHGTTRDVRINLQAQRLGDRIEVVGSLPVRFADWNIGNPSFGPVTTQDHGTMEFRLELTKA